ncbi:FAD-dependent monooxygenase [Streptomyces daliensis]|uniref:FAD-dependent monooxygenase n=1 Tax=Streptomyces daliensis TaxID=299421 RepID=A0A8T4IYX5_9ACTN|nr:FAD-dependent monooxygenase [Streptomyces daliensis]
MTHALIVGGGIAGAVTAMALRKAGIGSTVYEAYETGADDVGAFLVVFNNGLEALRTVDAHQPVLDAAFPAEHVELLSHTGQLLGSRPSSGTAPVPGTEGEHARAVLGPHTLKRATLYRVLHDEAARRGVTIEHGKRLTTAEQHPDGAVTAHFADGTSATGDLLIGADGIHSTTRALIDPGAPRPRHTGQTTVCGYARGVGPEATPPPATYRMVFGKRAFLGCTLAPDGEVWWFANTPGEERTRAELAAVTPAQWREHVSGLFADDDSPAAEIVRATGDGIVGSNAYDIASTPVWHRGSMVVIGDAAHAAAPNAAQGASMAIEDSVVLAKCLRDLPDPAAAFAAYEGLRRERVERVVADSARMSGRSTPRPEERERRDAEVESRTKSREAGGTGGEGSTEWLTHYRVDWDEPVTTTRS